MTHENKVVLTHPFNGITIDLLNKIEDLCIAIDFEDLHWIKEILSYPITKEQKVRENMTAIEFALSLKKMKIASYLDELFKEQEKALEEPLDLFGKEYQVIQKNQSELSEQQDIQDELLNPLNQEDPQERLPDLFEYFQEKKEIKKVTLSSIPENQKNKKIPDWVKFSQPKKIKTNTLKPKTNNYTIPTYCYNKKTARGN